MPLWSRNPADPEYCHHAVIQELLFLMDFAAFGYYQWSKFRCRRNVTNIQLLEIQLFAGPTCLDGKFKVSSTTDSNSNLVRFIA